MLENNYIKNPEEYELFPDTFIGNKNAGGDIYNPEGTSNKRNDKMSQFLDGDNIFDSKGQNQNINENENNKKQTNSKDTYYNDMMDSNNRNLKTKIKGNSRLNSKGDFNNGENGQVKEEGNNNSNEMLKNSYNNKKELLKDNNAKVKSSTNRNLLDLKEEAENMKKKNNKNSEKLFNKKILGSSDSSFSESDDEDDMAEEKFFLFFWKYLKKRELGLVSFRDKNKTIPFFVRWSCFVFCLIFLLFLTCMFFSESNVHNRYLNAVEGNSNDFVYFLKKELINSVLVALISLVFKMLIIKLLLFKVFKVTKETKELLRSHDDENQNEKYKFLKRYKIKLLIFFITVIILSLFLSIFCICYGGVFPNSMSAFLLGFLFSVIFSFIFCALLCFLLVGIYKIGKRLKINFIVSAFVILRKIY